MHAMALFCIMNMALMGYGSPVSIASSSMSGLIAAIAASAGYSKFMVRPWSFTGSEHSAHTLSRGIHVTLMSHTGLAATIVPGFSKLPVERHEVEARHAGDEALRRVVHGHAPLQARRTWRLTDVRRRPPRSAPRPRPQVSAANAAVYFWRRAP